MDLYIHSPIRLHGVVLNYLSRGKTLPFYLKNTICRRANSGGRHRQPFTLIIHNIIAKSTPQYGSKTWVLEQEVKKRAKHLKLGFCDHS
jgi:hypothetical protein